MDSVAFAQKLLDLMDGKMLDFETTFRATLPMNTTSFCRILLPYCIPHMSEDDAIENLAELFSVADVEFRGNITYDQFATCLVDCSMLELGSPLIPVASKTFLSKEAVKNRVVPVIVAPPAADTVKILGLHYLAEESYIVAATAVSVYAWDAASGHEEVHYRNASSADGAMMAILLRPPREFIVANAQGRVAAFVMKTGIQCAVLSEGGSSMARRVVQMMTCHLGQLVLHGDGVLALYNHEYRCQVRQTLDAKRFCVCGKEGLVVVSRNGALAYWAFDSPKSATARLLEVSDDAFSSTWITFVCSIQNSRWVSGDISAIVFAESLGVLVMCCDSTAFVFSTPTPLEKSLTILHETCHPVPGRPFTAASFVDDNTALLLGDTYGFIFFARMETLPKLAENPVRGHQAAVQSIIEIPAFRIVVSAGADGGIITYSVDQSEGGQGDGLVVVRKCQTSTEQVAQEVINEKGGGHVTKNIIQFMSVGKKAVELISAKNRKKNIVTQEHAGGDTEEGGIAFTVTVESVVSPHNRKEREAIIRQHEKEANEATVNLSMMDLSIPEPIPLGAHASLRWRLPKLILSSSTEVVLFDAPAEKIGKKPRRPVVVEKPPAHRILTSLLPHELIKLRHASSLRSRNSGVRRLTDRLGTAYKLGGGIESCTFVVRAVPIQIQCKGDIWARTFTPHVFY